MLLLLLEYNIATRTVAETAYTDTEYNNVLLITTP